MSAPVPPTSLDRLATAVRVLVRGEDPLRTFSRVYEYVVQATDGTTLTARISDGSYDGSGPNNPPGGLPALVKIPLRYGVPGTSAKPKIGSLCYVTWANADPSKPVCVGYDSASSQSITFDGGTGTSEHVLTVEAFVNLLANFLVVLGSASSPGGASGASALATFLFGLSTPTLAQVQIASAISTAAAPLTGTLSVATMSAIASALALKTGDLLGTQPNIGCQNIHTG